MSWITVISFVLRCFGLGEWLEGYLKQREAQKQAQQVADVPINSEEESKYWHDTN